MISISAEKLKLGYEGKIIVDDLNFSIKEGEFLCIVGENGSGKSTLVKAILNLIKPISGKIEIKSKDSENVRIGYLSQHLQVSDNFPAGVKEIVLTGCLGIGRWRPFIGKEQKKICEEKMHLMKITEIKNKMFGELSGGQKQRVLLARALCSAKDGIIMDEPVSGLDPIVTQDMYEAVNELKRSGMTVIMVTHDVDKAIKSADKVLHIGHKENFFGAPDEYLKTEIAKKYIY